MIPCSRFIFFISFGAVLFNNTVAQILCKINYDDFYASQIILFFAPMGTSSAIRQQISIYYYNPGFIYGDTVKIYSSSKYELALLDSFNPTDMKGIWNTTIRPQNLLYDVYSIYNETCLGYYGAWSRNGITRKMKCLSTNPDWMSVRKEILKNRHIQDLFIPGTHNSGSYSEDNPQSIVQQFTVTQDSDVFQQLMSGARYIDLRPSFDTQYWVNHGFIHMNTMDDIISDVKQFMDNTNEIVILSMSEFPHGFESLTQHEHFIKYLENAFANYLLPYDSKLRWSITLGKIWDLGKRLILTYNGGAGLFSNNTWPSITQNWANVRELEDLKTHFKRTGGIYTSPTVSMAELTLDRKTVVEHLPDHLFTTDTKSIRRLGALVAPHVTAWFNELFYSWANIVAVDYIDATGIVDVAIEWNERRTSPCYAYYRRLMNTDASHQPESKNK